MRHLYLYWLFLIALFLGQDSITAQTLNWVGSIESTDNIYPYAVTQDGNSDLYAVGRFRGTADFDMGAGMTNLTSNSNDDAFVAKYDLNGNFIRAFQIAASGSATGESVYAYDVVTDASNNVIVVGRFRGTAVNFDPIGSSVAPVTSDNSGSNTDAFVAKYNASGACQWVVPLGAGTSSDELWGLDVDAAGNVYVTGRLSGTININPLGTAQNRTTDGVDAVLFKYDTNGLLVWGDVIGGSSTDYGYDVKVHNTRLYLGGRFQGTNAEFNPLGTSIQRTSNGSYDAFVAQYETSNGNCTWVRAIGSSGSETIEGVDTDASGNVYVTGSFQNTMNLNPSGTANNIISSASSDVFVAKYDPSGLNLWGWGTGSSSLDNGYEISVSGSNVYAVGKFRNTADFDPSVGNTANLIAPGSNQDDGYLVKYDASTGAYINAFNVGSNTHDRSYGVYANNGTVYMAGYFSGTANFDPVGTSNLAITGGTYDGFVAAYDDPTTPTLEEIAITEWLSNPSGNDAEEEWIELYNYGSSTVNLKDWRLKDEDGNDALISALDLMVPAGEYVILARNKTKFEEHWLKGCSSSKVVEVAINLANGADEIILENAAATTVWSLAYSNDETVGRATHYTEGTYPNRTFGSKASPGVSRTGNDVTGSLGYQKNNVTADANAIANALGDIGSPLNRDLATYTRGNALQLNGTNQYLDLGATTYLENQTTFTFEAWVKPITIDAGNERIFSKRTNNSNRIEIMLGNDGSETLNQHLRVNICSGTNVTAKTPNLSVPVGSWTHVAVVFDGAQTGANRLKVYTNGIEQALNNVPAATVTPTGTGNAHIGKRSNNASNPSNIEIDELRLWTTARTAANIRENMHLTLLGCETGLASYYQLNESSGTTANDVLASNNATLVNSPTRTTSTVNVGNSIPSQSVTMTGVVTGTYAFTAANASLEFDTHSGAEDVTVSYQAFAPNAVAGANGVNIIQNPMWTINKSSATEMFTASYTFTFPAGTLTSTDLSKYGLYWRPMESYGNWTKLTTATAITATTATFSPISLTGQFMVVQESENLISSLRGNMYMFDGASTYIEAAHDATYSGVNTLTLEAWVYATNTSDQVIIHKWVQNQFSLEVFNNELTVVVHNGTTLDNCLAGSTFPTNEWVHCVGVFDGPNNELRVYQNGVLMNTVAVAGGYTIQNATGGNITMGRRSESAVGFLNGKLDEVRIWTKALSRDEIRDNMHLTLKGNEANLRSYYQFNNDDAPGTASGVKDGMGNNDGTTQSMTTSNLVESEVAVGGGISDRQTIGGAAVYNFPNTGVSIEFDATTPNGELVIYRIETEKPHGWNSIGADVDNEYFVVKNFGNNPTFDPLIDITFNRMNYISPADIGMAQTASPLQLYKRADNAFGATWGSSLGGADNGSAGSNGAVGYNATNNITSFSQIVVVNTNSNSDLPVELLSFEAIRRNSDEVELLWTTVTETNNKGFFVERMLDGEIDFSEVAWVDGHGTTLITKHYQAMDDNSTKGTSYYRLKQIDFDGTTFYSEIKAVEGMASGIYIDWAVYPNPVQDKLSVEFKQLPSDMDAGTIKLLTTDGKLLYALETSLKSNQVIELGYLEQLKAGVYILSVVTNNEEILHQKIIKQ